MKQDNSNNKRVFKADTRIHCDELEEKKDILSIHNRVLESVLDTIGEDARMIRDDGFISADFFSRDIFDNHYDGQHSVITAPRARIGGGSSGNFHSFLLTTGEGRGHSHTMVFNPSHDGWTYNITLHDAQQQGLRINFSINNDTDIERIIRDLAAGLSVPLVIGDGNERISLRLVPTRSPSTLPNVDDNAGNDNENGGNTTNDGDGGGGFWGSIGKVSRFFFSFGCGGAPSSH